MSLQFSTSRFLKASLLLSFAFALNACNAAPTPASVPATATAPATAAVPAPTENLTSGCVTDYQEGVDYFPQKYAQKIAVGFAVEYHNNYKLVEVKVPAPGIAPVQYALVQCGTPLPELAADVTVIQVPVKRFVSMSTTYLPYLEKFGVLDTLVGMDTAAYAYSEKVGELKAAGNLQEIGSGATVDAEMAVALAADMVMTYASGAPDQDAYPKLQAAGVPVVLNAEYLETDPLARADWGEFIALFFNQEAAAASWFSAVNAEYQRLTTLANGAPEKPAVLLNTPYEGVWYLPGGEGYMAKFVRDAGGSYLWADVPGTASQSLDFESVFARGAVADFWLNQGFFYSLQDLQAADERFAEFSAFHNGNVFNNNGRENALGSNDFYEGAVAAPEVVLADLVKILHPELLPDHELVYYQQLK